MLKSITHPWVTTKPTQGQGMLTRVYTKTKIILNLSLSLRISLSRLKATQKDYYMQFSACTFSAPIALSLTQVNTQGCALLFLEYHSRTRLRPVLPTQGSNFLDTQGFSLRLSSHPRIPNNHWFIPCHNYSISLNSWISTEWSLRLARCF